LLGDAVDVGLADTNPRMQLPQPRHEDTQPRVVLQDVYRQDTQPRVVLDESLNRDSDEEVSQGGKTRRPRRRVTSTGIPVVPPRPTTSTSRMAAVNARNNEEREAANHRRDEGERPVPQEITRRTAVPTRSRSWIWLTVTLVLLLLVGGGLSAAAFLELPHEQERVEPPPARPLFPAKKAAQAPAAGESAAAAEPTRTASANTENPATVEPAPVPAGTEPAAAPAEAVAAAPSAAPAGGTDTPVGEMSPEEALLAPLAAPSNPTPSAPNKRQLSRKRTSSRTQSMLQKEWARTRVAYKSLTRIYACENLDLLCSRYENLESEVVGMGDVESAELLGKVRALQREIQRRKKGS
jgi:serine/threonine-protein kinase